MMAERTERKGGRWQREARSFWLWLRGIAAGRWQLLVTLDERSGFSLEGMSLAVRWLGVLTVLALSFFIGHLPRPPFDLPGPVVAMAAVTYNLLVTLFLLTRRRYNNRRIVFAILLLDWLTAGAAVMLTGRAHSVFFILFFTLVITAAAQFGIITSLGYVGATFIFSAVLYWLGLERDDVPLLGILSVYINALGLAALATVALRQALYAEAERSRRASAKAEESANREQMERDFLSIVSHELRSPLTAMKTSISTLQAVPQSEAELKLLANVNRSTERLIALVNDLLDLARLQAGRLQIVPTRIDLRAVVEEAAEHLRPLTEAKRQELRVHLGDEPIYVQAEKRRVEQALLNLLFNANKFAPEGGHLSVALRRGIGSDGCEQGLVQVRDDGPGLSPEQQERVFDQFYSVAHQETGKLATQKRSGEGLGLGLAITRSLIELQGGQVGVQSRPGWGSIFYFWLPLCLAPLEAEE